MGFAYIENLCYVLLDPAEKESTAAMRNTDATPAIARQPYKFLNKSHKTLLMLRRVKYDSLSDFGSELKKPSGKLSGVPPSDNKEKLELRH